MTKATLLIAILSCLFCFSTMAQTRVASVGFYNLENLFDAIDDPLINDEEYLPTGERQWTNERYTAKLANMAKVLSDMRLDLVGVCEVENRKVLEDLINDPQLCNRGYDIIHFDSKDRRGIDVAALYRPQIFKLIQSSVHSVSDPTEPDFITRDVLLASGIVGNRDTLHFIVNHWPSRWGTGGEPKRLLAAQVARSLVDSLQSSNHKAKIVITGDFNDDPRNKSINRVLNAKIEPKEPGQLLNTSYPTYRQGIGTLYYNGAYNLFDQIIVSEGLTGSGLRYQPNSFTIASYQYLTHPSGDLKGTPYRTFSRGQYLNGYSDHFPVFITLIY